ncbi:hypothetical protein ABZP36_028517 [Zizania latifolia]
MIVVGRHHPSHCRRRVFRRRDCRRIHSRWVCAPPRAAFAAGARANFSARSMCRQRTTIYAQVDAALHKIRDTSESVQSFASEHLKTPLGEPVKGNKNKSSTELEKFYKKRFEGQLVDLSSLLYDAYKNSSDIL